MKPKLNYTAFCAVIYKQTVGMKAKSDADRIYSGPCCFLLKLPKKSSGVINGVQLFSKMPGFKGKSAPAD